MMLAVPFMGVLIHRLCALERSEGLGKISLKGQKHIATPLNNR